MKEFTKRMICFLGFIGLITTLLSSCKTDAVEPELPKPLGDSVSINNEQAGYLAIRLSIAERSDLTYLKVTGKLDARDFRIIRESMPKLKALDIANVVIDAYTGPAGTDNTNGAIDLTYPANTIPAWSFSAQKKWNSWSATILLPQSITAIGNYAFYKNDSVFTIVIPESVTTIGKAAFSGCKGLRGSLIIPASVTSIGAEAFDQCSGYNEIVTSSTSPTITMGSMAFANCIGLKSLKISNSISEIGTSAFLGCTGLTTVSIPSSVTIIKAKAFQGCTRLTSVSIPNSVTTIGDSAFLYCNLLSSATIPESVTTLGFKSFFGIAGLVSIADANVAYSSSNGVLFNKDKTILISCSATKEGDYMVPSTVETIDKHAFANCAAILSITIPASVKTINDYAFMSCSGLQKLVVENTAPQDLNVATTFFTEANPDCELNVPFDAVTTYQDSVGWDDIFKTITNL